MPAYNKEIRQIYIYTTEDIYARYDISQKELNKELRDGDRVTIHKEVNGALSTKRLYSRDFYKRLSKKYNINKCWG